MMIAIRRLVPLHFLIFVGISYFFLVRYVHTENVKHKHADDTFEFINVGRRLISWGDIKIQGPKICDAEWTDQGNDVYKVTLKKCRNGEVHADSCTILDLSQNFNYGIIYCDVDTASILSILTERFTFGSHFYYDKSHLSCSLLAFLDYLISPDDDKCVNTGLKESQIVIDSQDNWVHTMHIDNKLYVEKSLLVGNTFIVTKGENYVICNGNFISKFKVTDTSIESIDCIPDQPFCFNVKSIGKNRYKIESYVLVYIYSLSILGIGLEKDTVELSTQLSECKFKPKGQPYCLDNGTVSNKNKCKYGQCDALSCFYMYWHNSAKIGDISLHWYASAEIDDILAYNSTSPSVLMSSKKEKGYIKDSFSFAITNNSDIGIVNKLGYLSAIVTQNGLWKANYIKNSNDYHDPLICSEDKENLRICKMDTSITDFTVFNRVIKHDKYAHHFNVSVNGEEVFFNRGLEAFGKNIYKQINAIWHEDTLLAVILNNTLYTSPNARLLQLCSDGSNEKIVHLPEFDIFYQLCKNNLIAFHDSASKSSVILLWSQESDYAFIDYCSLKKFGLIRSIQSNINRPLPEYFNQTTDAPDCHELEDGQSRFVTLQVENLEIAKCYKVGPLALLIESQGSTDHWLHLCNNQKIIHDKCEGNRTKANCQTFTPTYFTFDAGHAFGLYDVCATIEDSNFFTVRSLEVMPTSNSDTKSVRHAERNDSLALCKDGILYGNEITEFSSNEIKLIDGMTFTDESIKEALEYCDIPSNIHCAAIAKYVAVTKNLVVLSRGFTFSVTEYGFSFTCDSGINPRFHETSYTQVLGQDNTGHIRANNISINPGTCTDDPESEIQCVTLGELSVYIRGNDVLAVKINGASQIQRTESIRISVVAIVLILLIIICICSMIFGNRKKRNPDKHP